MLSLLSYLIVHGLQPSDRRGERIQLCQGRKHIWTDGHVLQQTLKKTTEKDGNHLKQIFSYSKTVSSGRTPQVEPTRQCKGAPDPEAWEVTNAGITCQVTGHEGQSKEHSCLRKHNRKYYSENEITFM